MDIIKGGLAAAIACSCLVASAATWTNFTPNTPDTAYDWNTPGNWENGDVGGEGESVTILPSAKVYIRIPDGGVTVHKMLGNKDNSNAIFIGGPITLKSSGTKAEWTTAAQTHCDIVVPEGETIKPEIDNLDLRGHIINYSSVYVILRNGNNYFHFDYFAEAACETRTTDLVQEGNLGLAGGVTTLYGPEGAAAVAGTWRLVAGSPYATRISSTAHKLAVGTTVTAAGYLPSGTFLKRVFNNATIELSEPADAGGDVTLSFAAFTANFTARVSNRTYQHGSYGYFLIRKNRAQDVCRAVLDDYRGNQSTLATLYGGFSYDTQYNNGTLVFRKVTVGSKPMRFDAYAINLEFAGDGDTGVTTFPNDFSFVMTKKFTAHMLVTNNITGVVNVLTNFHGTVAKDGGGLLKIGLGEASNEGSFVVNGGTLQVMRNATVAGGAALSANSLTIKSGATFTLPEGGMTVNTLSFESGASLAGAAELTVENGNTELISTLAGLSRVGGATVRVRLAGGEEAVDVTAATVNGDTIDVADGWSVTSAGPSSGTLVKDGDGTLNVFSISGASLDVHGGEVALQPLNRKAAVSTNSWLHVDATESDTIVLTNAKANAVHSWADVNGTGRTLRSIRQQRDTTSSGWPLYSTSSTINGLRCVDIGARQTGSSAGLVVFEADGKISEGQDAVYSSMTAPPLKTFFVVYDSTAGGGTILGGVGGDFPKKGMPRMWYSDTNRPNGYPICYDDVNDTNRGQVLAISNACENGTAEFVRNGVVTNPCSAFFLGGPERMVFRHQTGRKCAVFGAYGGSAIRGDYFGGLKYGEIICFERLLSNIEAARVDAYLAKKWFNIDTPGYEGTSIAGALKVASGAKVTLLGGDALSATSVSGGGTVDGDLALSGGGIDIEIAEDGSLPCFNVTGAADLSSGGTVTVTGKFRDLQPGAYTILSSLSLSFGGVWSVSAATETRTFKLVKVGDSLVLKVFKRGAILIFK